MNEKITVELDTPTMAALSRQAAAHGRTAAEEIGDIVRRNCAPSVDRDAFLRRAAQAVRTDAGGAFDRTAFLRRARELALKSRDVRWNGAGEQPRGER